MERGGKTGTSECQTGPVIAGSVKRHAPSIEGFFFCGTLKAEMIWLIEDLEVAESLEQASEDTTEARLGSAVPTVRPWLTAGGHCRFEKSGQKTAVTMPNLSAGEQPCEQKSGREGEDSYAET